MSEESIPVGCGVAMFAAVFVILVAMIFLGQAWQDDVAEWRKEAVRRGAAEWVMDPATGNTEWRWKDKPSPPIPDTVLPPQPADQ